VIPLLFMLLLPGGHSAGPTQYTVAQAPPDTQQPDSSAYWAFVDLLASAWTPLAVNGSYDPQRAVRWDDRRLLELVSAHGITFYDATRDSTWESPYAELAAGLKARAGREFALLLHLGYMRAQPTSQYSRLTITDHADTVLVRVGGWYEVSLVREGAILKTVRVAYLNTELE